MAGAQDIEMHMHETAFSISSERSSNIMTSDTSNLSFISYNDPKELHDISFTLDDTDKHETKEIGIIAEREITLNKFQIQLKIKRALIAVCYLIIFIVESIYFRFFSYWIICPLLLCLAWISLLTLNTNLYQYLHKQTQFRFLFILSFCILNVLTVISLIVIYSLSFGKMHDFNHNDDYRFKWILLFNILFLFCSFCVDINIIDHREYTVFAYKFIFIGFMNNDMYKIQDINGVWITRRYTFQHPSFHSETESECIDDDNHRSDCAMINRVQPIGICQRVIIILFGVGMIGSIIFTINGIQRMQPYILH